MFGFRRRSRTKDAPSVPGQSGFGFGPLHIVYDKRAMPDPGAQAVAYLTELLPIEQVAGPSFQNQAQVQTVRRPTEMMVALQGVGLTTIGAPGIPAGYFALQPLTDQTSTPGNLPIIGNPPIGEFDIPGSAAP